MSNRLNLITFSNIIALVLILLFAALSAKSQTSDSLSKSEFIKLGYNEIDASFGKDAYSKNLVYRYKALRSMSYVGLLLAPTSLRNNLNPSSAIILFSASSLGFYLSNKRLLYKNLFDTTKAKNYIAKNQNDSLKQLNSRSSLIKMIDTSDIYNKQNIEKIRLKIRRIDRSLNTYFDNKLYENADDRFLVNKSEFIKMNKIEIEKHFSKNKQCVALIEAYYSRKYTKMLYLGLTGLSSCLTYLSYQELNTSHNDLDMFAIRPLTYLFTSCLTVGSLSLFLNDVYMGRKALLFEKLKKSYYN